MYIDNREVISSNYFMSISFNNFFIKCHSYLQKCNKYTLNVIKLTKYKLLIQSVSNLNT